MLKHQYQCPVCAHVIDVHWRKGDQTFETRLINCPSEVCNLQARTFRRVYAPTPFIMTSGGTRGKR